MDELKKKIEARGEELANHHKNQSVDSGMSEETAMYYGVHHGFRAALDLLWPAVEACEAYAQIEMKQKIQSTIAPNTSFSKFQEQEFEIDLAKVAREALRKIGGGD